MAVDYSPKKNLQHFALLATVVVALLIVGFFLAVIKRGETSRTSDQPTRSQGR